MIYKILFQPFYLRISCFIQLHQQIGLWFIIFTQILLVYFRKNFKETTGNTLN